MEQIKMFLDKFPSPKGDKQFAIVGVVALVGIGVAAIKDIIMPK